MIPYENLLIVNKAFHEEFKKSFATVLDSGWFVLGRELQAFEEEFAQYVGVKHCIGVGNGLDALTIPLMAWDFPKDSEVLVPSNTYIATIIAIIHAGLKPVLIEPSMKTYNIEPESIEEKITEKTKAILSVHLYGKACPIGAINTLAKKYHLKTMEDCAQAHGARHQNIQTGSTCDAGAYSFYPTKNLGCLGDGGAITTNDDDLADRVRMLRNYGSQKKYVFDRVGRNSRLDEIQAAFLRIKLKNLDAITTHKRTLAEIYHQELGSHVIKPQVSKDSYDVFHIYNIRLKKRDELRSYLLNQGIQTEVHYPVPPHKQKALEGIIDINDFPVSEDIHRSTLSLPISTAHSENDIYKVAQAINNFGG